MGGLYLLTSAAVVPAQVYSQPVRLHEPSEEFRDVIGFVRVSPSVSASCSVIMLP